MEEIPKIFGRYRPNLVKLYELLKAAENPLPRTRVLQAANVNQQSDKPLFLWLWKQGFLEKVDYHDLGKMYMAHARRPSRSTQGLFRTTTEGRAVLKIYEALFDSLGMSEQARTRFPRERGGVRTRPFSGQKVRA